jgi:hypothetical protein
MAVDLNSDAAFNNPTFQPCPTQFPCSLWNESERLQIADGVNVAELIRCVSVCFRLSDDLKSGGISHALGRIDKG